MPARVDLYGSYNHFTDSVMAAVRKATYGVDIGQNSWLTAYEHERFCASLSIQPNHHVLEVASGSGGPALNMARTSSCRVTGIDSEASGVATATQLAKKLGVAERVRFMIADANARLPFDDGAFDAIMCIDAMNHLPDRLGVLREWHRVLCPGGRALFTDPVVITGPVTNEELSLRSSIGVFVFVPPSVNEQIIERAGLQLVQQEDVTANAALVSGRWRDGRQAHRKELLSIEGEERFEGLQRFFETVHTLTSQRRLSRMAYLMQKPAI